MRTSPVSRALLALLACFSLIAAACGGSDDDGSTAADIVADAIDSDDETTESGDDDAGDTEAEDPPADDADEPPADEGDDDAPEDEEPPADDTLSTSGDVALFCARYAENEALFDDVNPLDPDQVETWINTSRGLLAEAIGDAPAELVPDLQTIQVEFDELAGLLEVFDYDFLAAADEVDALDEDLEADAASARLDDWIAANCPESDGGDAGDSLTDSLSTPEGLEAILGSEAGRELFIDGMIDGTGVTREQAECMIDNLDAEMLSALATDPNAIGTEGALDLLDVLSACGIDINALTG